MQYELYRGQHGLTEARIHTKLPSIAFGSLQAAREYATCPNDLRDTVVKSIVMVATIQIGNPVIDNHEDCFADFEPLVEKLGEEFMWRMADKHDSSIYNTNNWESNFPEYCNVSELKEAEPERLGQLYMDAFVLLDDEEFVSCAKALGYDGAIHYGNGETCDELEYRVFSQEQILKLEEVPI